MSEHGDEPSRGRRWWLIALAAFVALVLGVGLGSAVGSRGSSTPTPPRSAPSPASPSTTLDPAASGAPVKRLSVVAGRGGSRLAVDGKTPVGYPHTCQGAVAAATNYVSSAARLAWVRPTGDKLLDQISDADTQRINFYRKGQRTALNAGVEIEPHPEWGGFRLVACDSYNATVVIWPCEVQRLDGEAQRSCVGVGTNVAWVLGDWKLRSYEVPAEPPTPEITPDPAPGDDPLTAAQRRRALAAAGPDWQEYANAPR